MIRKLFIGIVILFLLFILAIVIRKTNYDLEIANKTNLYKKGLMQDMDKDNPYNTQAQLKYYDSLERASPLHQTSP